ncbi:ester cyclase [Salinigranum sp. GCM10025319]|uniref:ester cyclase n=1 Tax=Salinigranum sp. GCM10025319 TaxID=3252687 RepID=UPI003609D363
MEGIEVNTERVVEEYVDMWNERAYERASDLVTESFALYEPAVPDGDVQGPEGLVGFLRYIVAAFPDFEVSPIDVLADEGTVMMESTYVLTHEGEFEAIPPTGRELRMRGMHKFLIEGGKIAEHRLYYDLDEFFEQLGVSKP